MYQSLESHNLDKINGPSKEDNHVASMYNKTILPTRVFVPNLTIPLTGVTTVFLL